MVEKYSLYPNLLQFCVKSSRLIDICTFGKCNSSYLKVHVMKLLAAEQIDVKYSVKNSRD